jgi:xylulose-5-phosphate/fructose-6-phosphate phosphoketolase
MDIRQPLSRTELAGLDAYWRAANYLSVGQIYLHDNPLLKEPLTTRHIKPRLLGHFGTTPGLNLVYAHLNRVIRARDLSVVYIAGPGHGGPGLVANAYLEGTYSEVYTGIEEDTEGLRKLFRQFSFPGGIPSHVAAQTPGPSTRAASSATRWCTPTARPWTIRTWWWPASSVTARPRPGRWPPAGIPTNSSIR